MKKILITSILLIASHALANDVIVLESTFIGDREQPAVSFFIPWQSPTGPEALALDVESQITYWLGEADRLELSRLYEYYALLDSDQLNQPETLSD